MAHDGDAGLVARGLWKSYEGSWALTDVSLRAEPGVVVALVGHNGAGKSTLLRALSGAERPDRGELVVDGVRMTFASPGEATDAGIACVYQELSLVEQLTVAQNLFLGREHLRAGLLSRRAMAAEADRLCEEFGIAARGSDVVGTLSVAQRQMVEVARAVNRGSRYLLLDEPTTALELAQVEQLFATIRHLTREKRIGVLLVDHKLDEVFAVAERVVALSNGRVVLDGPTSEVDRAAVVRAVVGGEDDAQEVAAELLRREDGEGVAGPAASHPDAPPLRAEGPGSPPPLGPVVMSAEHVGGARLRDISLEVHAGEVLGIYGLVGAGRTRFLRTVYGVEPQLRGTLRLHGRPYVPRSARHAMRHGVAFLSEERKLDGFVPVLSGRDNVVLPVLDRFRRAFVLRWPRLHASADEALARVSVRGDVHAPLSKLSGGNQQKVLFAKAILQDPQVLLLDEPTKGVDIGAKAEIHALVGALAHERGTAVVMVSTEEEELLSVADRVVVFRAGECDGRVLDASGLTPARLRELAWSDAGALGTTV